MAVAFDAVSSATPTPGTTSPHTWTHTGVGANLAVIAAICLDKATTSTTVACTYNGVSMTLIGSIAAGASGNNGILYFFGIANAPTGAQTVSFTFSGTTDVCVGASVSFTGAGLAFATAFGSFQPVVIANGQGSGTNPGMSPASNAGGSVFCVIVSSGAITSMSGGGQKFLDNNTPTGSCGSIVGSTATGVGAGGVINFTSVIATGTWAIGAATIFPIVTPYAVTMPSVEDTASGKTATIGQVIARPSTW
jgi:hypothetical protein